MYALKAVRRVSAGVSNDKVYDILQPLYQQCTGEGMPSELKKRLMPNMNPNRRVEGRSTVLHELMKEVLHGCHNACALCEDLGLLSLCLPCAQCHGCLFWQRS